MIKLRYMVAFKKYSIGIFVTDLDAWKLLFKLRVVNISPSVSRKLLQLEKWCKWMDFIFFEQWTFIRFVKLFLNSFQTISPLSIFHKIIRKSCNRNIKFQSQVISQTFPRLKLWNLGKTCSTSITLQLPPITGTPTTRHSKNTPISLKFYRLQTRSHPFACFPFAVR